MYVRVCVAARDLSSDDLSHDHTSLRVSLRHFSHGTARDTGELSPFEAHFSRGTHISFRFSPIIARSSPTVAIRVATGINVGSNATIRYLG